MKFYGLIVFILAVSGIFGLPDCDENPSKKTVRECCDIPVSSEADYKKCLVRFEDQKRQLEEMSIEHGCCISECTLNASNVYTGNGGIDKTALLKLLTSNAGPEFKTIIPDVVDTCLDEAESYKEEFLKQFKASRAFPNEKLCHPISGFLLFCIRDSVFRECPDTKFTKNAACDALKLYAKQCPGNYME